MELHAIDIAIIVGFMLLSLAIGLYYKKAAGKSLNDFFLGGRNLPWWVAGVSMVATTFAADTPLAVSEMVAESGISKNWLWWSFLFGGMLTTFYFARLWRRSGVLTELELISLRYHGKPAFYLRLFKSIYLGVFMNVIIMAWVNLAFNTLLTTFFGIPENQVLWYTAGAMLVAVAYTSLSGLKGVAVTDTVQFVIAMLGTSILAWLVIQSPQVGGIAQLKSTLPQSYFNFFPSVGGTQTTLADGFQVFSLSIGAFFSFVAIQWWASWYPGAEPGGGGYIAQRMMSCKDEKGALKATLLFQIAHYCLRPWPWILVGLASVALYAPEYAFNQEVFARIEILKSQGLNNTEIAQALSNTNSSYLLERSLNYADNPRLGYVYAMMDFLPTGLKGLLLVAFLAAYMSTISTQLNWGASYLVNDFYLPLSKGSDNQQQLVKISRLSTLALMLLSLYTTTLIDSISAVWEFILECGAGLGMVLILRWYWWRINAWSEISASLAPFVGFVIGKYYLAPYFGESFVLHKGTYLFTVGFTTLVWLTVTYLTKPEPEATLRNFSERVKPTGWWSNYSSTKDNNTLPRFLSWLSAVLLAFGVLFGFGKFLLLEMQEALFFLIMAIIGLILLLKNFSKS